MITVAKKRLLLAVLATLLGAAVGLCAGYFAARKVLLAQTDLRLQGYARRSIDGLSASTYESRTVLNLMEASAYRRCSPEEISYLRTLIYESHYLKEAGRLRGGRVECSSTLGHAPAEQPVMHPDFIQRDGSKVFRNPPLFGIQGRAVIAVQVGDAFVVYNPFVSDMDYAPRVHYAVTDVDAQTHSAGLLWGQLPQNPDWVLNRNAQAMSQDSLYATRCSTVNSACVTAYMSHDEALAASRRTLMLLSGVCALTGGLLGLLVACLYRRNKSLPHQLLRAIRHDALRVVYQPIVDLETGRIVEAEALVRWTNDDNEAVSPDVFVKIAEDGGFVGEITRLVIRRVLRDFAGVMNTRPGFRVNVNIAAPDLADPDFLPMLQQALDRAGVRAQSLGVEITESYTARQQVAKDTILHLRGRGHHVAIDDFGTGYSSLAYLHDLSVDSIKIDKAFTRAIGTESVTVSILPQILAMAEQLGLTVVVEGIETEQQAAYFALAQQAIRAQGWLFGHPVAADAFLSQLAENDSKRQPPASPARQPAAVHTAASYC
ncbi:MAG TPA: EAL domain-containing protein [Terracidiphilus sp.]|nr:EAL domain-containing protein [Terracidiphilus sp.]